MLAADGSGYTVAKIDEETDDGLYALLFPKMEVPGMIVNVHLWITCGDDIKMRYLFATQPVELKGDAGLTIKQYINWWNEQDDYELCLESGEDEIVILTTSEYRSSDWIGTISWASTGGLRHSGWQIHCVSHCVLWGSGNWRI